MAISYGSLRVQSKPEGAGIIQWQWRAYFIIFEVFTLVGKSLILNKEMFNPGKARASNNFFITFPGVDLRGVEPKHRLLVEGRKRF